MLTKRLCILGMSIVLLVACSGRAPLSSPETDHYALIESIFKHEHSVSLFLFGVIMEQLSKADTLDDLNRIHGMVDAYRATNPIYTPLLILNNRQIADSIVLSDMRDAVKNMHGSQRNYIIQLQPLLEEKDLAAVQMRAEEFQQLYKLERQLNDHRLISKQNLGSYKKSLVQMNELLTR